MHFSLLVFGENVEEQLEPFLYNEPFLLDTEDDETEENENVKMDWFEIGGYYSHILINKEGNQVASELIENIDWEASSEKEYYESVWKFFVTGEFVASQYNKRIMEEYKRASWQRQAFHNIQKLYKTKENYLKQNACFATTAVIRDGEWVGETGLLDFIPEWKVNYRDRFLSDVPNGTLITIVDCHI